jgi:hypothetical protein
MAALAPCFNHSPRYEAELPRLKPGACCRSAWRPTGARKNRVDLAASGRPFDRELSSNKKAPKNHRITFLCDMVKSWPEKLTKTKEAAMKDYFSFQLFMRMSTALFIGVATYSMIFGHTW